MKPEATEGLAKIRSRYGERVIVDAVGPCEAREREVWETEGQIEALKERLERERQCAGIGWFQVIVRAGEAPRKFCSLHATRAVLRYDAISICTILLRCPHCGSAGSYTDQGVEHCQHCRKPI